MRKSIILLAMLYFPVVNVFAFDEEKFPIKVETLSKSSTSWDGGALTYPKGKPDISLMKITIPKGAHIDEHCHPVITGGYVIKGSLDVKTARGKEIYLKEGDGVVEVLNQWHESHGVGDPTEIFVFYLGEKNLPLTIKKTDNHPLAKQCK